MNPTDVLNITINADDKFTINGEVVDSAEALAEWFSEAASWSPPPALHVFPPPPNADGDRAYYFVGKVIYSAHRYFEDPHFFMHQEDGTVTDSKSPQPADRT